MSLEWKALPAARLDRPDWIDRVAEGPRAVIEAHLGFLGPVWARAPYLLDLSRKHPRFLGKLLSEGPDELIARCLDEAKGAGKAAETEHDVRRELRLSKSRLALGVALAELAGLWSTEAVTGALSDMADAALDAALDYLVREAAARGAFAGDAGIDAGNCGLALFALGKHGGRELNYSSDIDFVAIFDPPADLLAEPEEASRTYARIVRKLAGILEDRTEHGYVFRTDLRLRPDPGSTPVALSADAALTYYEARGQNWERAAWIKARPCAGDRQVGDRFLAEIAPFIWRKHLDFAAIADIQAMKRQINIARNVGGQRMAGHNVKLGRGGIREIEFFTQTQQLIAGGRNPDLRVRPTAASLAALAADSWIDETVKSDLISTYWFLRAVENRVQMSHDEQTHTLPTDDAALKAIAGMMGFEELGAFEKAYLDALETVTENYVNLFTEGESLSSTTGNLVFTGTDDDPATLETLESMGFEDAGAVSATVRKWHYGSYAATRTDASRAHLTELMPVLLETFAEARNADAALARFDHFLSRLPAGVQFFALLRSHTELCRLLVAFMASAPKMAEAVIRRAHVMDGLIDPSRASEVLDPDVLQEKLNDFLDQADGFEDLIDRARILGQEQMFLISAALISGSISAGQAGRQYTVIADTLIDRLVADTRRAFIERHGKIAGARIALLGFGKLGSREMSVSSDLDMILLYDVPEGIEESDGKKPLEPSQYFTRLTQRLISAISAPTATGVLYEVDMRLRPSGNAGPVATSFRAFKTYQAERAWTWEHLALTRARAVFADGDFGGEIDNAIAAQLAGGERAAEATLKDVHDMRQRLLRDRPARHPFDLKLIDGGLMDLDFIAQSAVLLSSDGLVDIRTETGSILERLDEQRRLEGGADLADTYRLMSTVVQVMSACMIDPFKDEGWTDAFKALLARLTNYPDFERLEAELGERSAAVRAAYAKWFAEIVEKENDRTAD